MRSATLAGRKLPGNPHPNSIPPIGRRGVTVSGVPPQARVWGFGWTRAGEATVARDGMTVPEVLDAYRHAWRCCNGAGSWSCVVTFDGHPVEVSDELLIALDDANLDRKHVTLRLAA